MRFSLRGGMFSIMCGGMLGVLLGLGVVVVLVPPVRVDLSQTTLPPPSVGQPSTATLELGQPLVGVPPPALAAGMALDPWSGEEVLVVALVLSLLVCCIRLVQLGFVAKHQPTHQLRAVRLSQGLSYLELAQRTQMSARIIAEIEHGVRPLEAPYLQLIAQALQVEDDLLLQVS